MNISLHVKPAAMRRPAPLRLLAAKRPEREPELDLARTGYYLPDKQQAKFMGDLVGVIDKHNATLKKIKPKGSFVERNQRKAFQIGDPFTLGIGNPLEEDSRLFRF